MSLKKLLLMDIRNIPHLMKTLFPKPVVYDEKRRREIERRIVSRYSNGNASLYFGRYVTTADIEKRKNLLRGYSFVPKNIY